MLKDSACCHCHGELEILLWHQLQAGCPSCNQTNSVKALNDAAHIHQVYHNVVK